VRFAATTSDDVADSQSVHFVVVASEDHLRPVNVVPVLMVGTVLEIFLSHFPEIYRVASNDDHDAGDCFVAKGELVQGAGFWIHGCCVEETHDMVESKRPGPFGHVVSPLSLLVDTSEDREGWRIVLFRVLVKRRHTMVREAMVEVLVSLFNVGSTTVFLPDLNNKVLKVAVVEAFPGRDDLVVVPNFEPVAHLELFRKLAKVPRRIGLEVSVLQLLTGFFQFGSGQDSSGNWCF